MTGAPASSPDRLRDLARRHRMRYRVQPEWGPDPSWNQQRIGFALELHAASAPEARAAMREVLEWAVADGAEVKVTIDATSAPAKKALGPEGWLEELTAHILHDGDVRRPLDRSEQGLVRLIQQRLKDLGVAEA